jgi:hypothetical protein
VTRVNWRRYEPLIEQKGDRDCGLGKVFCL